MLERIGNLPTEVDGIEAIGKVERRDYDEIVEPLLNTRKTEGKNVRLLFWFGPRFESFSARAAWEDVRVGMKYLSILSRCAVVTDVAWIKRSTMVSGALMPCPVRMYANDEFSDAVKWLAGQPTPISIEAHIDSKKELLVLTLTGSLHREDFEHISNIVDPWIKEHGGLHGIVVQANQFPGWKNFGSMLRHVSFIRKHHKAVKRVAIVSNSAFLEILRTVANYLVSAETRHFSLGEFDAAMAWAAAGRERQSNSEPLEYR